MLRKIDFGWTARHQDRFEHAAVHSTLCQARAGDLLSEAVQEQGVLVARGVAGHPIQVGDRESFGQAVGAQLAHDFIPGQRRSDGCRQLSRQLSRRL